MDLAILAIILFPLLIGLLIDLFSEKGETARHVIGVALRWIFKGIGALLCAIFLGVSWLGRTLFQGVKRLWRLLINWLQGYDRSGRDRCGYTRQENGEC